LLLGRITPVDDQGHAGHVRRVGAGEEDGAFCDVLHEPPFAPWGQGGDFVSDGFVVVDGSGHGGFKIWGRG
jgi:hypothetical protein